MKRGEIKTHIRICIYAYAHLGQTREKFTVIPEWLWELGKDFNFMPVVDTATLLFL